MGGNCKDVPQGTAQGGDEDRAGCHPVGVKAGAQGSNGAEAMSVGSAFLCRSVEQNHLGRVWGEKAEEGGRPWGIAAEDGGRMGAPGAEERCGHVHEGWLVRGIHIRGNLRKEEEGPFEKACSGQRSGARVRAIGGAAVGTPGGSVEVEQKGANGSKGTVDRGRVIWRVV